MGVELSIRGIRKLRQAEIEALTGKTKAEIEDCEYFRRLFPRAPADAWYCWYEAEEIFGSDALKAIRPMLSAVEDDTPGHILYVMWAEELGYYWHKNPADHKRIDRLLEDVRDIMDWDETYHALPYRLAAPYIDRDPVIMDGKEEIIAFIYG